MSNNTRSSFSAKEQQLTINSLTNKLRHRDEQLQRKDDQLQRKEEELERVVLESAHKDVLRAQQIEQDRDNLNIIYNRLTTVSEGINELQALVRLRLDVLAIRSAADAVVVAPSGAGPDHSVRHDVSDDSNAVATANPLYEELPDDSSNAAADEQ